MSDPAEALTRLSFLLRHPQAAGEGDDLSLIMAGRLGGYFWATLPLTHRLRPALRRPYELIAQRHAVTRAALRDLLSAWNAEGLPTLLFKGFALAEFAYAQPGVRYYGDVDILVRDSREQLLRRVHLAMARGWRTDGHHLQEAVWTHEVAHLVSPDGQVRIDVHRTATPWPGGSGRRARAVTHGVWERAQRQSWEGVTVQTPSPLDAAALLVLGRCWGGDQGSVKVFDWLDLHCLARNHDLIPATLSAHAARLGGRATWTAFTRVCSPWEDTVTLDPEVTRPVIDAGVRRDRAHRRHAQRRLQVQFRVWVLPLLPLLLPDLLAARVALRAGQNPVRHLQRWAARPARPAPHLNTATLSRVVIAARMFTNALYPRQRREGVCAARAYATFRAVRRLGYPAVFCSGVALVNGKVLSHAWVEGPNGPLAGYGEPQNRERYQLLFQYPP